MDTSEEELLDVGEVTDTYVGKERESNEEGSVQEETMESVPEKRKRGRPQTTGLYIGRAKAKRELIAIEREEMDFRLEKLATDRLVGAREVQGDRGPGFSDIPMSDLKASIKESLEAVNHYARISKGLKGTTVKGLKNAAAIVAASVQEISLRFHESRRETPTENTAWESKYREARKEIEELRREINTLKNSPVYRTGTPTVEQQPKELGPPKGPQSKRLRKRTAMDMDSSDEDPEIGKARSMEEKEGNTVANFSVMIKNMQKEMFTEMKKIMREEVNNIRAEMERKYTG